MKNAQTACAELGAVVRTHCKTVLKLSPRQGRCLKTLSNAGEWVSREAMDRITGSSNSPDVIRQLRGKLGEDAILTRFVDGIDRDGRPCRTGQYKLTDAGFRRLAEAGLCE